MKKSKIINKKIKKLIDKKCFFCGNNELCTLDVHRIIPGCQGGKYNELNTITCCSCCHRKIHNNKIKIDRKYPSTHGWVLHYFDENNQELWISIN